MKTVYVIRGRLGRLYIAQIPVLKETDKIYYLDLKSDRSIVDYCSQLKKCNEGITWTTDETKFKELAQKYVDNQLFFTERKIIEAQKEFERLKEEVINAGLELK